MPNKTDTTLDDMIAWLDSELKQCTPPTNPINTMMLGEIKNFIVTARATAEGYDGHN